MDSSFIEIIGHAGLDFVIIDLEHSPNTFDIVLNHIRAAENNNLVPIIRVPHVSSELISKALDIGAYGVQVPQVSTPKQVEDIISFSKFYPKGERGLCRFVREANFSKKSSTDYIKDSNRALVIIQIEGETAFQNLDKILEVDGIDIVFIGPYDLSQSLNCPGEINSKLVLDTMNDIILNASNKGVATGVFSDTLESLSKWKSKGVKYLSYSVDVGIFYDACKQITKIK